MALAARPALGLLEPLDSPLFLSRKGQQQDATPDSMSSSITPSTSEPSEPELVVVTVSQGQPCVTGVSHHSATFTWPELDGKLPSGSPRYALELQQLENTNNKLGTNWVCAYSGESLACKVNDLKAGRSYAVRVVASTDNFDSDDGIDLRIQNADPVIFQTQPTVPSAVQPPALVQRARNALKLKWNTPEDPGGIFELTYVLEITPAPLGLEDQRTHTGFVEVYRGPERSYKVTKLQPGIRYTSRVQALNKLGEGPFSLCSSYTTQATVPSQPEPPACHTASSTALTLAWTAPADNGSPIVCYTLERDDGAGGDFMHVYAGPNTTHTIKGLRPGLQYRFRLRADNDEGKSMWSPTVSHCTGAAPPDSPVSLQVVSAGRQSATMAWRAPDEDGGSKVLAFEVELQAKSRAATACMGSDWLKIFDGEAHACTINSLRPGCSYRVRVRARNSAGWGQWAIPVDLTTTADAPEAPLSLQPATSTPTTIVITWAAPRHDGGAKVHTYHMEMAPADCACGQCPHAAQPGQLQPLPLAQPPVLCPAHAPLHVYSGETIGAELRHLQPACRYIFRVQAANGQGSSPWTDWVAGCTTPDVPIIPAPPSVAGVAATALVLSWQVPPCQGAVITSYTVEFAPLPVVPGMHIGAPGAAGIVADPRMAAGLQFRQAYRGPHTTCEVRALEPYTGYAFRLCAQNEVGPSGWSVCTAAVTGHAPPTCPRQLSCEPASSSQVMLCWSPPERDFGSPVVSYSVEMAAATSSSSSSSIKGAGSSKHAAASSAAASWTHVYTGPACVCHAKGLAPGRSYQFRVRATSACGCGPFSAPVVAATLPAPPSAPGRPVVTGRTATGLRVRWEDPEVTNGAIVSSHVLEVCVAGTDEWTVAYSGSEASAKLSGLLPATKYLLRAASSNSAGQGPCGETEAATTMLLPPQPPSGLRLVEVVEPLSAQQQADAGEAVEAAMSTAVCIAWEEPEATATQAGVCGYEATATPKPGCEAASLPGGGVLKSNLPGRRAEAKLEGLMLGCQYGIRVRSVGLDGTGHSSWSEEVLAVMPPRPEADTQSLASSQVLTTASAGMNGGTVQQRKGGKKGKKQGQQAAGAGAASSGAAGPGSRVSDDGSVAAAGSGAARGAAPAALSKGGHRVVAALTTVSAKKLRKPKWWEAALERFPGDAVMEIMLGDWRRRLPRFVKWFAYFVLLILIAAMAYTAFK